MSRRRITFIALTAVASIAFVIDRFVLGDGPESASAATVEKPKAKSKAGPAAKASPDKKASSVLVVDPSLTFLDKLGEPRLNPLEGRDMFAMTNEMMRHFRLQEEEARQAGILPGSAGEFINTHRLEATYVGLATPLAVISGEVLAPGDQIDDFTVTRVTAFDVELRRGRDRVVLVLPKREAAGAKRAPASRNDNRRSAR